MPQPQPRPNSKLRNWVTLALLAGFAIFMYVLIMLKLAYRGF
jgi:hypothetical protein